MTLRDKAVIAAVLAGVWASPAMAADLVVSAAASLTNAFREVGQAYEAAHPGTKLTFNFAASDVLLRQIEQGAPADVFASADQTAMDRAVAQKAVLPATRVDFAANKLVLITPVGVAATVTSTQDLAGEAVKRVAYGNPASVPVGRYTEGALKQQNLWDAVAAKGVPAQNVRQSLDYVARGEVDAGFVYATDAQAMPDRVRRAFEVPVAGRIAYPLAVVQASTQPAEAKRFTAFVRSPQGQAILVKHGFGKP